MQDTHSEKRFFDRTSHLQEGGYFTQSGWDRLAEIILSLAPQKPKLKILDLGCGTGDLIRTLAQKTTGDIDFTGIDISEASIADANRHGGAAFLVGDIADLHPVLGDNKYDVIILSSVIHHFTDSCTPVQKAADCLADHGVVISYDPNPQNPFFNLYRNPSSWLYSSKGLSPNERLLTIEELEKAYSDASLHHERFGVSGISFQWVESALVKRVLPIYNFLDKLLFENTRLEDKYGAFILVVGRKESNPTSTKCPACETERITPLYRLVPSQWYQCGTCGTVFTPGPVPTNIASRKYHDSWDGELYSKAYSSIRRQQAELALQELEQHFSEDISILDVGCGAGCFVAQAISKGHIARGIDESLPKKEFCQAAESLSETPLNDIPEGEKFDAVTAFGVLEHIYSPRSFFKGMYGHMHDQGVILVSIPMISGLIYTFSHALFRYSAGIIKSPWLTLLQWGTPAPHVFLPTRAGMLLLAQSNMPTSQHYFYPQPIMQIKGLFSRIQLELKRTSKSWLYALPMLCFGICMWLISNMGKLFDRHDELAFLSKNEKQ